MRYTVRKFVCNRSLEKIIRASLIALWFALRKLFFVEKMMSHVMLVNDCRQQVMSLFLQKKKQKKLWCQIDHTVQE